MKIKAFVSILTAGVLMAGMFIMPVSADWKETSKGKMYYDENGKAATGMTEIDGDTYYFSGKGIMQTGWVETKSGKKYLFSPEGKMWIGWYKPKSGNKYYFGKNGLMYTGLHKIDGANYYFSKKGILQTGWIKIEGTKYFFDPNNGGKRAQNTTITIDGVKYKFNSKGVSSTAKTEKDNDGTVTGGKKPAVEVYPTEILVDNELVMSVREKKSITPMFRPAGVNMKELKYKSSNTKVVKVTPSKNGHGAEIEAVGKGTAKITVTSKYDSGVSEVITIRVTD